MGGGKIALAYNRLQKESLYHLRCAIWTLLQETGLLNSVTMHNKTSVYSCKKLSDSFLASGRLDAEYYQPKYDRLLTTLSSFPTAVVKDIAVIQKSIEPGSEAYQEEGVPFIRVSNLSKFGISDSEIKLDAVSYANVIRPKKDTILLSKDGSVGIAYKVEEPMDIITSGAILHLSVFDKSVLPDYLTLVLNSIVVKLQAERDAGGSIIQHWKPSEIENVVIPILPQGEQQRIANTIQESFRLRKESQLLLERAKSIVEQAIDL